VRTKRCIGVWKGGTVLPGTEPTVEGAGKPFAFDAPELFKARKNRWWNSTLEATATQRLISHKQAKCCEKKLCLVSAAAAACPH